MEDIQHIPQVAILPLSNDYTMSYLYPNHSVNFLVCVFMCLLECNLLENMDCTLFFLMSLGSNTVPDSWWVSPNI